MDKRTIDLTGQTFKNLYVIKYIGFRSKQSYWLCKCLLCGDEFEIRRDHLLRQEACRKCSDAKKIVDMTGRRYGRLVVEKLHHRSGRKTFWQCLCDCGNTSVVRNSALTSGNTKSCGCLNNELRLERNYTHRMSDSIEYQSWSCAKTRCTNENINRADRYSGRGIIMCDRWFNSFENFYQDMGKRPSKKHSLDRIDNNGNYEPGNCRWATQTEQMNNTSINVLIDVNGEMLTRGQISKRYNLNYSTIRYRIAAGWDINKIISTRPRPILHNSNIS